MELEHIVQRVIVASTRWHCDITLRGFGNAERLAQGLHAVARKLEEGQEAGSGKADGAWLSWTAWDEGQDDDSAEQVEESPFPTRLGRP